MPRRWFPNVHLFRPRKGPEQDALPSLAAPVVPVPEVRQLGNFREVLFAEVPVGERKVRITLNAGDITHAVGYDAIARMSKDLQDSASAVAEGGGGVEKAIGNAGGFDIYDQAAAKARERRPDYGRFLGEAVTTSAGGMENVQHIVHVNLHRAHEPVQEINIRLAVLGALREAEANGITSILFPIIGTGVSGSRDGLEQSASAVITLNAINEYLADHQYSKIEKTGIILNSATGQEYDAAMATKYLKPAGSKLTFQLQAQDGTPVTFKTEAPVVEAREAEVSSLPTVLVKNKPYTPDELVDALTSENLKAFDLSLLKFVRADVIDGESREAVFFIDRHGGDHDIIYDAGREALTTAGGKYEGRDVKFQLIDAGKMYIRPTRKNESGDFVLEITGSSGHLGDQISRGRRARNTTEIRDRQNTVELVEQLLAARKTDNRQVSITTQEER